MSASLDGALAQLPHGPEFRFVDRMRSLVPGQRGEGEYRVRGDEVFLRGHFPGHPIFPGVLLAEAGAQLAGVVAQSAPDQPVLLDLRLAALQQIKIYGAVEPGETVVLRAEIVGRMGGLIQARVGAWTEGRAVMEGSVVLSGRLPEGGATPH